MSDNKNWSRGFDAGVLSALAVVAAGDGGDSTTYIDIVEACGLNNLIREARREKDSQLKHLLYIKKHRRRTVA